MVEYFRLTNHGPHYWYVRYVIWYDGGLWFDFFNDGTISRIPDRNWKDEVWQEN